MRRIAPPPKSRSTSFTAALWLVVLQPQAAGGAVGDPQLRTDHPWYPGELAISDFRRLAATQAVLYQGVTGQSAVGDEDRALAAWLWRNTHYAHGEEGAPDTFGKGFRAREWNREYWRGLFAHGFGLCGTTHAQWTAEMDHLLGPCRGRVVGVSGHNSFEVWLQGGAYGRGRWVLLDHDLSTVIFDPDGRRLLAVAEVAGGPAELRDPRYRPARQRGWRVAGLHDNDAGVFDSFRSAEYRAGYAGPPPLVHLRRGESLRRFFRPGLEDGETFVFWGRNYRSGGIPGPARDRTWVNQPEKMFGSERGAGWKPGRARYGNAVYTYRPDFAGGSYREGVVAEGNDHVVFEFRTPYVIAATPPGDGAWDIYADGCRRGLVITGLPAGCALAVSTDRGANWQEAGAGQEDGGGGDTIDLTDAAKGHTQYLLRLGRGVAGLAGSGLTIRTVCQLNPAILPHLRPGKNQVTFAAGGRAIVSAGPNQDQAEAHRVDGSARAGDVTLEITPPRGRPAVAAYAASWNQSGNPPRDATYHIAASTDGGQTWTPIVEGDRIVRRAPEPGDFWSQSFTYGEAELKPRPRPVRVRFWNDKRIPYRHVEAHLAYTVGSPSATEVTFAWKEGDGGEGELRTAKRSFKPAAGEQGPWTIEYGPGAEAVWVEMKAD